MMECIIPYDMPKDYKIFILKYLRIDFSYRRIRISFTNQTSEVKPQ